MARRQRNRSALAGLAALGALGYISGKGPLGGLYKRREGDPAPVEDRSTGSSRDAFDYNAVADRQNAEFGGRQYGGGSGYANMAPAPSLQETFMGLDDVSGPNADTGGVGRVDVAAAAPGSMGQIIQGGAQAGAGAPAGPAVRPAAGAAARPAAARAPINDREHVFGGPMGPAMGVGPGRSGGPGGFTAQDIRNADGSYEALERRRLSGRAPATASNARNVSSAARQYNQDAQGNRAGTQADGGPPITRTGQQNTRGGIPGQSAVAPQGGQRVSGNEFTRNLENALMALGPTRLAGFGNAAVEGATARAAAQRAAVLRAERAEAARRGQTPTTFTSTRPSDATKRTRKFNEEDSGVEFKRGGKTKKMASGGMTSASKRGDGIASKGKTKCKMY